MINPVDAATPEPNAFSDVENNNNDVQKNHEEVSNVQTENSSNAQAKETDHIESTQRDNEANAKLPPAQDESRGTIVDILT
jgi:hypothetical protein